MITDRLIELLEPDTLLGAFFYAALFLIAAGLGARVVRIVVRRFAARAEHERVDRTGIVFLGQLAQGLVYVFALVLYAHLVPPLRQLGTALLASVSIASVVLGLAAQSTLGNIIAGFAILIYRQVRLGDRVQVGAPGGPMIGVVESLNLGFTAIRMDDGRLIIVPNSTMVSQVTVNLNDAKLPDQP